MDKSEPRNFQPQPASVDDFEEESPMDVLKNYVRSLFVSNNILSLLLGAIVVIIIIIGILFGANKVRQHFFSGNKVAAKPTPTPTASLFPITSNVGLKTYTNGVYKFALQYPSMWHTREDTQNYNSVDFMPEPDIQQIVNKQGYVITVYVNPNPDNTTSQDYWNAKIQQGVANPAFKAISVNGTPAVEVMQTRNDARDISTIVTRNGYVYYIQLNYFTNTIEEGKQKWPDSEKNYRQVLSSFKFTQ